MCRASPTAWPTYHNQYEHYNCSDFVRLRPLLPISETVLVIVVLCKYHDKTIIHIVSIRKTELQNNTILPQRQCKITGTGVRRWALNMFYFQCDFNNITMLLKCFQNSVFPTKGPLYALIVNRSDDNDYTRNNYAWWFPWLVPVEILNKCFIYSFAKKIHTYLTFSIYFNFIQSPSLVFLLSCVLFSVSLTSSALLLSISSKINFSSHCPFLFFHVHSSTSS